MAHNAPLQERIRKLEQRHGFNVCISSCATDKCRFAKAARVCYTPPRHSLAAAPFPGSSVVEQPAVNRLVAGSNPARGATDPALVFVL
jgi:hypothetical protein